MDTAALGAQELTLRSCTHAHVHTCAHGSWAGAGALRKAVGNGTGQQGDPEAPLEPAGGEEGRASWGQGAPSSAAVPCRHEPHRCR